MSTQGPLNHNINNIDLGGNRPRNRRSAVNCDRFGRSVEKKKRSHLKLNDYDQRQSKASQGKPHSPPRPFLELIATVGLVCLARCAVRGWCINISLCSDVSAFVICTDLT